ncbi:hypothetical protein JCM8202_001930 [Rhodotorula sphaerocarpa]
MATRHTSDAAALPPLLRLSTELLDRIVTLSVPAAPRLARKRLAALLAVHPVLVPIIRRALYRKVNLVIGDPRPPHRAADQKFLALLRAGVAGPYVHYLRLRLPDPPDNVVLHPGQDPAFALLPRPHLSPADTLRLVAEVVRFVPHVRHVEFNLQVGVNLEEDTLAFSEPDLADFGSGLERWSNRLETCISAVEDPKQQLQIWASDAHAAQISPQVRALACWDNLARLDLWRVRLVLPTEGSHALPTPSFQLRELVLTQCELGGPFELEWLLGPASVSATASAADGTEPDMVRSSRLRKLVLDRVDFVQTPRSSEPLRAVFPGRDHPPPACATTLEHLVLVLLHPMGPVEGAGSSVPSLSEGLLAGLSALRMVEVGGPGVDEPLLASLFGLPDRRPLQPPVVAAPASARAPSTTIRHLTLTYLTHPTLPVPLLLTYLNPSPSALAPLTYDVHPLRDLDELTFKTSWDLPRRWSWEERQRAREPVWAAVHADGDLLREEGGEGGWEEVQKAVGELVRERNRAAVRAGRATREGLRLFKNRLECTYDDGEDSDVDGESAQDGTEADEDRGARSASEVDPNGLFEPSSGDEEDQNAWVRRRIQEEEDYESDF